MHTQMAWCSNNCSLLGTAEPGTLIIFTHTQSFSQQRPCSHFVDEELGEWEQSDNSLRPHFEQPICTPTCANTQETAEPVTDLKIIEKLVMLGHQMNHSSLCSRRVRRRPAQEAWNIILSCELLGQGGPRVSEASHVVATIAVNQRSPSVLVPVPGEVYPRPRWWLSW